MVNENYNTVVKLDVEDAIIEYLRNNKTFKMFCSSLEGLSNIKDISFSFKYTPTNPEENIEIERCKTDSTTKGWTRKPIPIPSKTKSKKLKKGRVQYDGELQTKSAYYEDIGD